MKQYCLEDYLEIKICQILSLKHDTTFKFQKDSFGEEKQPRTNSAGDLNLPWHQFQGHD